MSDQCIHCVLRGDLKKCLKTPCFHHENWFERELLRKLIQAVALLRRTPDRGSRVLAEYRVEVGKFLARDDVKGIGDNHD